MKNHIDSVSISLFEGISEDEIDAFKLTLAKIENNIEKERNDKVNNKELSLKIMESIRQNENLNRDELLRILNFDKKKINKSLDKLLEKNLLEEQDGVLFLKQKLKKNIKVDDEFVKKVKKQKQNNDLSSEENREGKKAFYKLLSKKSGVTKDELIKASSFDDNKVDELLNRLQISGLVENIDGKYYLDKDKITKSKKRHKCKK